MPKFKCYNKYPQCLNLELITNPPEINDTHKEFDVYLNLKFDQQSENIHQGKIIFGLKSGLLSLVVENCEISWLNQELDNLSESQKHPQKAAWQFSSYLPDTILNNSWQSVKIATVKINQKPYRITATFTVDYSDIYLQQIEGLWKHDITPNKHGILTVKLVEYLLEYKIKPCVSKGDLTTETNQETLSENNLPQHNNPDYLSKLIDQVYQAETDDFLALATIAAVNPKTELVGANLMGCDLQGIDLTGANLTMANLRGANLTDTDLSEVLLSYAKLSGADLSGAYLGSANLNKANLNRASLALANLSGADLEGASLKEANLTNTNLSGAKLTGAQFGNNPGISEELKRNLTQRGAIFED